MARGKARLVMIGMVAALAITAGCSNRAQRKERTIESYSAEEIYKQAEVKLESGRKVKIKDAARLFGEVERLYPYSEWAKRALIMQAFTQKRLIHTDLPSAVA